MAISNLEKEAITNSIYGFLARGGYTEREILSRLGSKYDLDNADFLTVINMIRRASTAGTSGEDLSNDPNARPSGSQLPADWSLYGTPGRYGYRVKVTYTDSQTGEQWNTVVIVSSDTPLTGSEVFADAVNAANDISRTGNTTNTMNRFQRSIIESYEILSAGRRP